MKKIQNILGATLTVAVLSSVMAGCADNTAVNTQTTPSPTPTPSTTNNPAPTPTPTSNSNSQTTTPATSANYKDGTFKAEGDYMTPGGMEKIDVSVTLKSGKIEEASFVGKPVAPASKMMQEKFNEGFKTLVVGKDINDVSLSVVNGSSLTPKGFMDALNKIKAQSLNA